jgi:hypothetical protein
MIIEIDVKESDVTFDVNGEKFGPVTVTGTFTLNTSSKPLGENELERLDGTREMAHVVYAPGGIPCVCDNYPWHPTTNLERGFVLGSSDRAKRIFSRLYKFRDDEGVDVTTGKLRTMAINEARHPETGEIVRLTHWVENGGTCRRFGNLQSKWSVAEHHRDGLAPIHYRCIAYRDHVLALEKQLAELK